MQLGEFARDFRKVKPRLVSVSNGAIKSLASFVGSSVLSIQEEK